jgi:transposase
MGYTDMRKGLYSLTLLVSSLLSNTSAKDAVVVFRGKAADKIKLLWWDGQGFCLFYKCFDTGRFMWPKSEESGTIGMTRAQLSMLLEGIDWRMPKWADAPKYIA